MLYDGGYPPQFTASSVREAMEWVDQINFVLKGMSTYFQIYFKDTVVEKDIVMIVYVFLSSVRLVLPH